MNKRFTNKIAVITGGGGKNIGRSISINFAKEGAIVILAGKTESNLEEVCKIIKKFGGTCLAVKTDLSKEKEIINLFKTTLEKFGAVDILINNAAQNLKKDTVDTTADEWDNILNVNLKAPLLCSREALKIMIKNNYGKIINISSLAGKVGLATRSAYCASKFGLLGLTESMAAEVKNLDININAVCPAAVGIVQSFKLESGNIIVDKVKKFHPNLRDYELKPLIHPDEIAKVVLFLASDDASAIKGRFIDVYGGQTFDEN
jgi:NAD(P)-dependent dehydrogenase (short-subunit alcohol dehydrogenase family)